MLQLDNIVLISLSMRHCVLSCLEIKLYMASTVLFFCRFMLFFVILHLSIKQQLQVEFYCCWLNTSCVVGIDGRHFIYEWLDFALLNASKFI
jgi:hypothetical protein